MKHDSWFLVVEVRIDIRLTDLDDVAHCLAQEAKVCFEEGIGRRTIGLGSGVRVRRRVRMFWPEGVSTEPWVVRLGCGMGEHVLCLNRTDVLVKASLGGEEVEDLSIGGIEGDFEVAFLDGGTVCASALNVAVLGVVAM